MNNFQIFDPDDIVNVELISYEGFIFEDFDNLKEYLNSCNAIFVTDAFLLNFEDQLQACGGVDSLCNDLGYDIDDFGDYDLAVEALYQDFGEDYEKYVKDLLTKYHINVKDKNFKYELSGLYGNLSLFIKNYSSYLDIESKGQLEPEFKENAEVDIDSGDEDFVLAKIKV